MEVGIVGMLIHNDYKFINNKNNEVGPLGEGHSMQVANLTGAGW